MPRPPRIDYPGALHHVTSRGNARQRIFFCDHDRIHFVERLQDYVELCNIDLFAYVLMTNHYHLLLRSRDANLSAFIQRLNCSLAQYIRSSRDRPGHLFQGRFDDRLIESERYLLTVSRYVHLNPVKTKPARRLPQRDRLDMLLGYRWSSLPGYLRAASAADWVNYEVLSLFGKSPAAARRNYRRFLRVHITRDDEVVRRQIEESRYAIGSDAFVAAIERELADRRTGSPRDADLDLPRPQVELDAIDDAVSRRFGIPCDVLRQHGNRAGPPKAAAVELAVSLTTRTQRDIGQHYGRISSQAVSMIHRRVKSAPPETKAVLDALGAKLLRDATEKRIHRP